MPQGGTLEIATANSTVQRPIVTAQEPVAPGEYVTISVADTGGGILPELMSKVFEPFFTTKPIGQGTGLGLAMIYGFAKQSNGHLHLESDVGKGTRVTIYLPRHEGPAAQQPREHRTAMPAGVGQTVLVVEDDPSVRLVIADLLRESGFACLDVPDGSAALGILASDTPLDLMITDVGLPGINGRLLAERARLHRPDLKILFVTGYAEHATGSLPFLSSGMAMVTKPFTADALAQRIRDVLAM